MSAIGPEFGQLGAEYESDRIKIGKCLSKQTKKISMVNDWPRNILACQNGDAWLIIIADDQSATKLIHNNIC